MICSTIRPSRQIIKDVKKICNVYDLGDVDNQHSYAKSIGKYVMVNRVKKIFIFNLQNTYVLGRACYKNESRERLGCRF